MIILNALTRLRDDIKTWVTNNINILNTKIDNKIDASELNIQNNIGHLDAGPIIEEVEQNG